MYRAPWSAVGALGVLLAFAACRPEPSDRRASAPPDQKATTSAEEEPSTVPPADVSHGEAAIGGPIAHIQDGDIITLDATTGEISVDVTDEEFARRKKAWAPRETEYGSGAIWKYAQLVGPARYGALTNPGAKGEKEQYADI